VTSKADDRTTLRADIQALRAAAVGGVVLFHLWPGTLRGGYAGVDVFFVISGFLITSHLVSEIDRHDTVRLLAFWGRRLRRLMPLALTVLAASAVGVFALVPRGLWEIHLREVIASALYAENWLLAHDAVDYLAAENSPSIAQHYWSLAVEEQFYIVWPLLLLGALAVLPRHWAGHRRIGVALGVVFVTSLAASVIVTAVDPGPAYFVTHTRAWEFAAGGLLAVGLQRPLAPSGYVARASRWVGWTLIAVTFVLYTGATPFPGWTALVPVLGTVLVIAAGDAPTGTAYRRITGLRPVQEVGTLSYGIYLWHWPLIVLAPFVSTRLEGVPVLLATVVVAWLSYRWIENPIRFHPRLNRSIPLTYLTAATAAALVVVTGLTGLRVVDDTAAASERRASDLLRDRTACLGASAVLSDRQPCTNPALDGVVVPAPAARLQDTKGAYACYTEGMTIEDPVTSCHYGPKGPDALKVAIVGDSHAATLIPGLKPRLNHLGWSLDTYVGRGCRWKAGTGQDARCREDLAWMKPLTDGTYDLILVTQRRDEGPLEGDDTSASEMAEAWKRAIAAGSQVVAIADDPRVPQEAQDCIERSEGLADLEQCTFTREQAWAGHDSLPRAVELAGEGASLVDLGRVFCEGDTCPVVIGHVIVYRDSHHMTATFVKTLTPYLVAAIKAQLAG
jgi:peptidoglycan/LPS O-acetylase OafA/YrhL